MKELVSGEKAIQRKASFKRRTEKHVPVDGGSDAILDRQLQRVNDADDLLHVLFSNSKQ